MRGGCAVMVISGDGERRVEWYNEEWLCGRNEGGDE